MLTIFLDRILRLVGRTRVGLLMTLLATVIPCLSFSQTVQSLTFSTTSAAGGYSSTGTVTLSGPAPDSGLSVILRSDRPSVTVPSTVLVAGGTSSATFTATTVPVPYQTYVQVKATANASNAVATLRLKTPVPIGVSFSPSTVVSGSPTTATVTLDGVVATNSYIVSFTSDNSNATIQPTIRIPAGQSSTPVAVNTLGVSAGQTAHITARAFGVFSATGTLSLTGGLNVKSMTFSPSAVKGGQGSTGTITLNGNAPTGFSLTLASSAPTQVIVPSTVSFTAGSNTATFPVKSAPVRGAVTATIKATAVGISKTATFTLYTAVPISVSIMSSSVAGGQSVSATVTLDEVAVGADYPVSLTSSSSGATVPATVNVHPGSTTASFTINTVAVSSDTPTTITASINGGSASQDFTVTAPNITSLSLDSNTLVGGNSTTATVTISSIAPAAGFTIVTTSDNGAATTTGSVTIPAGTTSATFPVSTTAVASNTIANIGVQVNASSASAQLEINAPVVSSVTLPSTAVLGGTSSTGSITLSSPAPAGGLLVTLGSNSSAASVPSSVLVTGGNTSATFDISTSPVATSTTVTVTASANGTASSTFTVAAPTVSSVVFATSPVLGGPSVNCTLTLTGNAPVGGFVLNLASSDPAMTPGSSVTVLAGNNSVVFSVGTTPVATSTTAQLLVNGVAMANLTIHAPSAVSITLAPTSVNGGVASTATVTLNGFAPTGGFAVSVGSNNAAARVSSPVIVPAGTKTATFAVTTVPVASTQTATISTGSFHATLTIVGVSPTSVTLSPASVIGGTGSVGTVTINAAAPTGGVTVTITSSATGASTPVSSTVTIPAGSTSATFAVNTSAVTSDTNVTYTASINSFTATGTLQVKAPQLTNLVMSPTAIDALQSSTGTITLNGPAPTGGLVVNLSSSLTAAATVPASIRIAAGSTTGTFTASTNGSSNGTTTITASANSSTKTATLKVTGIGTGKPGH